MKVNSFLILGILSFWFGCGMAQQAHAHESTKCVQIIQQEKQQQDSVLFVVQQFYVEYITQWLQEDRLGCEKLAAIQKQYLTPQFFDRLQNMYQELELDYDPFLEAQDCDKSVLEKLRIEKDAAQAHVYRVFLWDNFNRKYKEVRLLLKKEGSEYKIDDILSLPNIYRQTGGN